MASKASASKNTSRLSTLQPPEWATWSLNSAAENNQTGEKRRKRGEKIEQDTSNDDEQVPQKSFKLQSLLHHRNDEDIYRSEWQTCYDDKPSETHDQQIDKDDVKEIGKEVQNVQNFIRGISTTSEKALKAKQSLSQPVRYDFSPLHPLERDELERHLHISKYNPKEDEMQEQSELIFESYRRNLFSANFDESKAIPASKLRTLLNWEKERNKKGKRKAKENEQKRKAFENLCRMTMPMRNVDWLIAQIIYPVGASSEIDMLKSNTILENTIDSSKYKKKGLAIEALQKVGNLGELGYSKSLKKLETNSEEDQLEKLQSQTYASMGLPKPLPPPPPGRHRSIEKVTKDSSKSDSNLVQSQSGNNENIDHDRPEDDEDNDIKDEVSSNGSDWGDLDFNGMPLEGIIELSESLERCHNANTYKALRNYVIANYGGEIPSWLEARLQPASREHMEKEQKRKQWPEHLQDVGQEEDEEMGEESRKAAMKAKKRSAWLTRTHTNRKREKELETKEVNEVIESEIARYWKSKYGKDIEKQKRNEQDQMNKEMQRKQAEREKKQKLEQEEVNRVLRKKQKKEVHAKSPALPSSNNPM